MLKNRGIAFRLGAPVLLGSLLIFVVIFGTGYLHSRDTILQNVEKDAKNVGQSIVNRIESVLAPVEKMPGNLAVMLEDPSISKETMLVLLRKMLAKNPQIFGTAIAFDPYGFDPQQYYFAPYISRRGEMLVSSMLGGEQYRYFFYDWYQIPKETGKPSWSEPYFDEGGGNIPMVTYSTPFFHDNGRHNLFVGVVTADISLNWLADIVSSMKVYQSGYGFILSRNGTFVIHPERRWVMNETIFSIAEAKQDQALRAIGREMTQGKSNFVPMPVQKGERRGYLFYAPIHYSDWSLGIFFPEDEMMADLFRLNSQLLYLALGGLVLLTLVTLLVARTITRPLKALSGAARQMATGNLEIVVPSLDVGGEVGFLARSFDDMKRSLKEHIKGLLETNAAKERMESELSIAREIQMGLIPKIFPPFPDVPEFDLYAILQPAREVGGDLYDFYRIDKDHICFFVGDVSGKGVPASLFMAVTMTLIKMTAAKGLTPDKILEEVNNQLSRDNSSCMFVTLFCGILHTGTGQLLYASGGHNAPVLLRKNSRPEFLEETGGILLGAGEGFSFAMKEVHLQAGDGLVIYSDGVTEAMNEAEELYSEERLLSILDGLAQARPKQIVESVMASVLSFAGSAPQSDDITLMMVRYNGV